MKRCPTSLAIWEIQIQSTMRYHYTAIRKAKKKKKKNSGNANCWLGWEETRPFIVVKCRMVKPLPILVGQHHIFYSVMVLKPQPLIVMVYIRIQSPSDPGKCCFSLASLCISYLYYILYNMSMHLQKYEGHGMHYSICPIARTESCSLFPII